VALSHQLDWSLKAPRKWALEIDLIGFVIVQKRVQDRDLYVPHRPDVTMPSCPLLALVAAQTADSCGVSR